MGLVLRAALRAFGSAPGATRRTEAFSPNLHTPDKAEGPHTGAFWFIGGEGEIRTFCVFMYFNELRRQRGKYSSNPPLQSFLEIVRDTGGVILYKAGHDKPCPTSGYRYAP